MSRVQTASQVWPAQCSRLVRWCSWPFSPVARYAFSGFAPKLVAHSKAGAFRPALTRIAISAFLGFLSVYAFLGRGLLRHLPALRVVLGCAGLVMLGRSLLFLPVAVARPGLLLFILTSGICAAVGVVCSQAQCSPLLTMRSSGPRGEATMFPSILSAAAA